MAYPIGKIAIVDAADFEHQEPASAMIMIDAENKSILLSMDRA